MNDKNDSSVGLAKRCWGIWQKPHK